MADVKVAEKGGWLATANKVVVVLTQVIGALTAILAFIQKLALDANPAASAGDVAEAGNVLGYGSIALVVATVWGMLSKTLIPKFWAAIRVKVQGSNLDPAIKLALERTRVEGCLDGLSAPFEGDVEAEDRIRWLAQRYEQKRIDSKFPSPAKGAPSVAAQMAAAGNTAVAAK